MATNAAIRHRLQGSFRTQLQVFAQDLEPRVVAIQDETAVLALDSIVNGSAVTGSPGQPEASGALKRSWRIRREGTAIFVESTSPYARVIEYNIRSARARYSVRGRRLKRKTFIHGRAYRNGGAHSTALTRAALPKLVEMAVVNVVGAST